MRAPVYDDPREPWSDDFYEPRTAPAPAPDVWVDLDAPERIPFGFQRPRTSVRRLPLSRQARANMARRAS